MVLFLGLFSGFIEPRPSVVSSCEKDILPEMV